MMSKQNRRLIKPMFAFMIGAYMSPALANTVDVKFKGTLLENPLVMFIAIKELINQYRLISKT